jgi:ABC-2 type transport system permease protein
MKWGVLVMPLKTSWFNRQILMQGFRQVGWVGWIYLFALLLFVPLHLVMIFSNENISYYGVENVLFANSIQFFLIIVIPVLLAAYTPGMYNDNYTKNRRESTYTAVFL